jgi:hypothetical protein
VPQNAVCTHRDLSKLQEEGALLTAGMKRVFEHNEVRPLAVDDHSVKKGELHETPVPEGNDVQAASRLAAAPRPTEDQLRKILLAKVLARTKLMVPHMTRKDGFKALAFSEFILGAHRVSIRAAHPFLVDQGLGGAIAAKKTSGSPR